MTTPSAKEKLELQKLEREIAILDVDLATRLRDAERNASGGYARHVLAFSGAVEPRSVAMAVDQLHAWFEYDKTQPITIRIDSPGGYVFEGFGLYDTMRELVGKGASIETRVTGYAASMAGVLLQGGSKRSMTPHSYLMIHEVGSDTWGKTSEIRDELELMEKLEERCIRILSERSTMTVKQIRDKSKRKDWWLDAREAKKLGFIDVVR